MATFYRLTCEKCSKEFSVAQSDAGSQRRCECGTNLNVPRLMELRRLPVVDEKRTSVRAEWNPTRGYLVALGLVLIAIGAYMHFKIDPLRQELDTDKPVFADNKDKIQDWPLEAAWDAWTTVRDWDLNYRRTPKYLENRQQHQRLTYFLYFGWGLASIGGVLVLIGVLIPNSSRM